MEELILIKTTWFFHFFAFSQVAIEYVFPFNIIHEWWNFKDYNILCKFLNSITWLEKLSARSCLCTYQVLKDFWTYTKNMHVTFEILLFFKMFEKDH